MTITQQEIIALAVEAGAIPASDGEYFPSELVICESMFETFAMAAYQRGVRDEQEAAAKLCEEIYTNGDGAEGWLEIAANRIRARSKEST